MFKRGYLFIFYGNIRVVSGNVGEVLCTSGYLPGCMPEYEANGGRISKADDTIGLGIIGGSVSCDESTSGEPTIELVAILASTAMVESTSMVECHYPREKGREYPGVRIPRREYSTNHGALGVLPRGLGCSCRAWNRDKGVMRWQTSVVSTVLTARVYAGFALGRRWPSCHHRTKRIFSFRRVGAGCKQVLY